MIRIATAIGHVMMGIVNKKTYDDAALRTWADIEYGKDRNYAYHMLKQGKTPRVT